MHLKQILVDEKASLWSSVSMGQHKPTQGQFGKMCVLLQNFIVFETLHSPFNMNPPESTTVSLRRRQECSDKPFFRASWLCLQLSKSVKLSGVGNMWTSSISFLRFAISSSLYSGDLHIAIYFRAPLILKNFARI